jgi:magnesium-transporting ATPase (P-type)
MYSFEFTPERKRSSVIVEDIADKKIFMYTKGADCVMMAK